MSYSLTTDAVKSIQAANAAWEKYEAYEGDKWAGMTLLHIAFLRNEKAKRAVDFLDNRQIEMLYQTLGRDELAPYIPK